MDRTQILSSGVPMLYYIELLRGSVKAFLLIVNLITVLVDIISE